MSRLWRQLAAPECIRRAMHDTVCRDECRAEAKRHLTPALDAPLLPPLLDVVVSATAAVAMAAAAAAAAAAVPSPASSVAVAAAAGTPPRC